MDEAGPDMAPDDLSAISIVVLSHNRKDALEPNLFALIRMVRECGCELIVVDNASTDGSAQMIREAAADCHGMKALLNDRNLGVGGGRNVGWRAAGRDYILNIDDDTIVTVDAVRKMLTMLRDRPEIGVVSPRIKHARTGEMQFDFGHVEYRPTNFHGACHMVRRTLLETVGFNDDSCTFGGEELDLSIRARAAGQDVVYTPGVTVLHDSQVRHGREGSDRLVRWLYNLVRIHHKHFPLVAALPLSWRYLMNYLVTGVRARGPSFAVTLIGSAWRGWRDGRRQHHRVPKEVVAFYTAPDRLPDIGNVPILEKLRRKWQVNTHEGLVAKELEKH